MMSTTTQNPVSVSRFSRLTFGLGLKSNNTPSSRAREDAAEDQWYIPYSGPVEPPREPARRVRERDSWGDPIEGDNEEDDTALTGIDLHQHYTGVNSHSGDTQTYAGGGDGPTSHRSRAQSAVSGRTVSSGVVDPSRASVLSQRRSTFTSVRPAPLLASGGVGESPMPPTHRRSPSKEASRGSIAGFFSFTGQTRNKPPSEKGSRLLSKRSLRMGQSSSEAPSTTGHRRSSSTGSNSLIGRSHLGHGADDYYNSYYFSTNAPQNTRSNETSDHPYGSTAIAARQEDETTPTSTSGSDTRHPYSYAFSTSNRDAGPLTAPLPPPNSKQVTPPKLTFTEPQSSAPKPSSANVTQTQFSRSFPFQLTQLKNSVSTPDLRISSAAASPTRRPAKLSSKIKTKDRWLTAETWCDAILFPRPRLKVKASGNESGMERIVSLPPSPVQRVQLAQPPLNATPEHGVASRVLAHSRSLADLGKTDVNAFEKVPITEPGPSTLNPLYHGNGTAPPIRTDRAPRPKSWALDDLALPTPVPSLARVVEEGEKFENQRKQWHDQATQSFQNKLTRSLSRTRSKSLTQKGRRKDDVKPSNIDFLVARAYLGSQLLTPVVTEHKFSDFQTGAFGNVGFRTSHSHSNSFAKTWSKSTKSHSRGHSRSDSFGRGLLKKARPAGLSNGEFTTDTELDNILRGDDTKVIRLADPALARNPTPLTTHSPTPPDSLISDARIGIALTTPPLIDDPVDAEAMRMPAHPYAQGGLFSFKHHEQKDEEESGVSDYVVSGSPTTEPTAAQADANTSTPRDFPFPDAPPTVPYHPYAQQPSSRNSFLPATKFTSSNIPASSKMWAQLSPGILREVLPNDIQYSPFMSENGDELDHSSRNSQVITDISGIGETLAYAVRPKSSTDSGLRTTEGHDTDEMNASALSPKRGQRQLFQYDTTRPQHLLHDKRSTADPYSAHTFASSPLFDQQNFAPELPRHDSYDMPTRTVSTSAESSSHSPHLFGDPDDLEGFYDLFYNPNRPSRRIASEASYSSSSGTPLGSRRGGSGLASLARQLSEEIEQMALEQDVSQYSNDGFSTSIARRPTGSTLEFVFEEASSPSSASTGLSPPGQSTISPFQPSSANIPEDVESSRSSSPLEPDNDETAMRLRMVGLVTTPPVVDGDHRTSYIGEMSSPIDKEDNHATEIQEVLPQSRVNSGLQPPSADPTRSSYLTTSSMSRMSGLSDFPTPPQRHAAEHMSILTSYFAEAHSLSAIEASRANTPPPNPDTHVNNSDGQNDNNPGLTIEEEMEELAAALSSHSHSHSLSTLRHS